MPPLPSFLKPPGSFLCVSIIALANVAGFGNSLAHGRRTPWFDGMSDTFFAAGGIVCQYKVTASLQLCRKFKEAVTLY